MTLWLRRKDNLHLDPFDFVSGNERLLLTGSGLAELERLMRGFPEKYLMVSRDYAEWGAYNRPLAKLSEAIKIADACNQREAERRTFSAITIWFREDTKSLNKTDGEFHKDAFLCDLMVLFTFLFGEGMVFGALFWQEGIGVHLSKPLISSICFQYGLRSDMNTRILEQFGNHASFRWQTPER